MCATVAERRNNLQFFEWCMGVQAWQRSAPLRFTAQPLCWRLLQLAFCLVWCTQWMCLACDGRSTLSGLQLASLLSVPSSCRCAAQTLLAMQLASLLSMPSSCRCAAQTLLAMQLASLLSVPSSCRCAAQILLAMRSIVLSYCCTVRGFTTSKMTAPGYALRSLEA
jgi:hypothetical protein